MRNRKLKELWKQIKNETLSRRSPHQIALGIGIGSFMGILPLYGFKSLLVVLIGSLYKRVNLITVFTASTVFSFIPVVPFVYFFDYWVGTKILGMPVIFSVDSFKHFTMKMLGSAVGALFLGGAVAGITVGISAYLGALLVVKKKHSKRGI